MNVVGEHGLDLFIGKYKSRVEIEYRNCSSRNYLLAVPGGRRARFGDAHTEAVDASVLVVGIQSESVGFALVTARTGDKILCAEGLKVFY